MYNLVSKCNPIADDLLKSLSLTPEDFQRYRDAYLTRDLKRIIVFTRLGGGNRESYEQVFERMRKHELYITDYDDSFDCTYCSFEFKMPEDIKAEILKQFESLKSKGIETSDLDILFMTGQEKLKKGLELLDKY